MKLHESITSDRIEDAAAESMFGLANPGFCTTCGEGADGVEPDAREYHCEGCGAHAVYGAEELLHYL